MALPTIAVTPGVGQTINTLPNGGQALAASSLPVVLASDQPAVPVSGTVGTILQDASGRVMVGGVVADGIAPTGNSIHIGGVDAGGLKRTLKTDTGGQLLIGQVDGANVTIGAKADTLYTGGVGSWSVVALLKGLYAAMIAPTPAGTAQIGTVLGPLPAAPVTGQQTTTASAVAMASNALVNGIVITALAANTATIYVGPSGVTTSTGYPLTAGQSISFAVANSSGIYIIGTNTTDKIAFAGN